MKKKNLIRFGYIYLPPLLSVTPLTLSIAFPLLPALRLLWGAGAFLAVVYAAAALFFPRIRPRPELLRAVVMLSVGFLTATVFCVRFSQTADRYGADPMRLTVWHGSLSGDSRRLDHGRTGYTVRCTRAEGTNFSVSVDCERFFIVRGGEKLRKGQPVSFAGCWRGEFFRVESMRVTGEPSPFWALRARLLQRFSDSFFIEETDSGAFFEALILGDRDELNSVLVSVFRDSGCLHLVALSGMHLAILIGAIRLVFARFVSQRILDAVSLPLLGFYVILTGSGASLKRAYTMFVVAAVVRPGGKRLAMIDILCHSLTVNSLLYPQETAQLGMQLSFAAVFGIVLLARPLQTALCRRLPKAAAAPLAVSYAAQVAVAPLLFLLDGLNPGGIFATILASPPMTFFMYLRFVSSAAALAGASAAGLLIARFSDVVYDGFVAVLIFFAKVPTLSLFPFGVLFFIPLIWILICERMPRRGLFFFHKNSKIKAGVSCD